MTAHIKIRPFEAIDHFIHQRPDAQTNSTHLEVHPDHVRNQTKAKSSNFTSVKHACHRHLRYHH